MLLVVALRFALHLPLCTRKFTSFRETLPEQMKEIILIDLMQDTGRLFGTYSYIILP